LIEAGEEESEIDGIDEAIEVEVARAGVEFVRPHIDAEAAGAGEGKMVEGEGFADVAVVIEVGGVRREEGIAAGIDGGGGGEELEVAVVIIRGSPEGIGTGIGVEREEGVGVEIADAGEDAEGPFEIGEGDGGGGVSGGGIGRISPDDAISHEGMAVGVSDPTALQTREVATEGARGEEGVCVAEVVHGAAVANGGIPNHEAVDEVRIALVGIDHAAAGVGGLVSIDGAIHDERVGGAVEHSPAEGVGDVEIGEGGVNRRS